VLPGECPPHHEASEILHALHCAAGSFLCPIPVHRSLCVCCAADTNYNAAHEGAYQGFYNQPDCPGYRGTLARHAQQLVAAGVDHVLVDMTNMPFYSPTADAIQLRPFEVLVEEWAALRAQVSTQQLVRLFGLNAQCAAFHWDTLPQRITA